MLNIEKSFYIKEWQMRFGIIGYGNLGRALVRGLINSGISQCDIVINTRSERTRNSVKQDFEDIVTTEYKKELVEKTDAIIIVVEPKNSSEVLNEIGSYYIRDKIIVSLMAGITTQQIKDMLDWQGKDIKLIRVMPNIAISNCNGILGITYDEKDYEEIKEIIHIFERLGYMLKLDECDLDYITVTAASGLAFAASLMNSYQKASNTLFNDEVKSKEITLRVFENLIDMVRSEGDSFDEIVRRIATKGGTTEAGIKCLNQELVTETLKECIKNCYDKAKNIM